MNFWQILNETQIPLTYLLAVIAMVASAMMAWRHDRILRDENSELAVAMGQHVVMIREHAHRLDRLEAIALSRPMPEAPAEAEPDALDGVR